MADTITRNSTPTVPIAGILFIAGYDTGIEIESILHAQLNGSGYNVTYKPARLRSGTLTLLFATAAQAWAAVDLLKTSYSFALTADVTQLSMTFVLRPGTLKPQHGGGRAAWTVEVPYQEVTP